MTAVTANSIAHRTCIVRDTASGRGRTQAVTPATSAARLLHYGRIIAAAGEPVVRFETGDRETALVCLRGSGTVRVEAST